MRVLIVATLSLFAAAPAWAECPDASYGAGTVRALSPGDKGDVDLILSMSMMPKLLHVDYRTEASRKPACRLTEFEAGSTRYELRADDTEKGTRRVALPDKKGAPIAELMAVTNIMEAIEASKQGKTAPVSGYMLATVSKDDFTGWRLYTGVPSHYLFHPEFKSYSTIALSVFAAAAGLSSDEILNWQNTYALYATTRNEILHGQPSYPTSTVYDPTYKFLPHLNVTNTNEGYALADEIRSSGLGN